MAVFVLHAGSGNDCLIKNDADVRTFFQMLEQLPKSFTKYAILINPSYWQNLKDVQELLWLCKEALPYTKGPLWVVLDAASADTYHWGVDKDPKYPVIYGRLEELLEYVFKRSLPVMAVRFHEVISLSRDLGKNPFDWLDYALRVVGRFALPIYVCEWDWRYAERVLINWVASRSFRNVIPIAGNYAEWRFGENIRIAKRVRRAVSLPCIGASVQSWAYKRCGANSERKCPPECLALDTVRALSVGCQVIQVESPWWFNDNWGRYIAELKEKNTWWRHLVECIKYVFGRW